MLLALFQAGGPPEMYMPMQAISRRSWCEKRKIDFTCWYRDGTRLCVCVRCANLCFGSRDGWVQHGFMGQEIEAIANRLEAIATSEVSIPPAPYLPSSKGQVCLDLVFLLGRFQQTIFRVLLSLVSSGISNPLLGSTYSRGAHESNHVPRDRARFVFRNI